MNDILSIKACLNKCLAIFMQETSPSLKESLAETASILLLDYVN